MRKLNLIGISGTNGSGKDSLGEILANDHGWMFISVTEMLRDELRAQDLAIERENTRKLSESWRRQFGNAVLVDKAFELFQAEKAKYQGLAISSLRNPSEAEEVQRLGGKVVWIDADPKLRYKRIYSRQRTAEDNKTFEQFLKEENDEMYHHGGDDATLNMAAVKAIADVFVANDNNNFEDFKKAAKQALEL